MIDNKFRIILPFIIIGVVIVVILALTNSAPEQNRQAPPPPKGMPVEVHAVVAQDYQVVLQSYGKVRPRTQINLQPQVSGRIVAVSERFRDGGIFAANETLMQIDPSSYQAALARAEADVAKAEEALALEKGRARQAKREWRDLGDATANALFLREPQLQAAQATLAAANAEYQQAKLNLQRTNVSVPFPSRILAKRVDIGQMVNTSSTLAEVFATDYVEIRLPLKNSDLPFMDLPESAKDHTPAATFYSSLTEDSWQGAVVRSEGAIDETTRQLYVIGQIDSPFEENSDGMSLKIGQYLTAKIVGKEQKDAIVIPAKALYQGEYVYLFKEDAIYRQTVVVAWSDGSELIVEEGLQPGDQVIVSPLGSVISGTPARVISSEDAQ